MEGLALEVPPESEIPSLQRDSYHILPYSLVTMEDTFLLCIYRCEGSFPDNICDPSVGGGTATSVMSSTGLCPQTNSTVACECSFWAFHEKAGFVFCTFEENEKIVNLSATWLNRQKLLVYEDSFTNNSTILLASAARITKAEGDETFVLGSMANSTGFRAPDRLLTSVIHRKDMLVKLM